MMNDFDSRDKYRNTLTAAEFKKAAAKTRMMPATLKMAKEVMVQGNRVSIVATKYNQHRQAVSLACKKIFNINLELNSYPKDWIELKVILPEEAAERVKAFSGYILEQHKVEQEKSQKSRRSRLQYRQKSPYQIQFNLKVRAGMKEFFNDLGEELDTLNNVTFEMALAALIEREGLEGSQIDKDFKELLKGDS